MVRQIRLFNKRKLVGYIKFKPEIGYLEYLYVNKKFRREGYGRKLVNLACNEIKNKEIWLNTYYNHPFWRDQEDFIYFDEIMANGTPFCGSGYIKVSNDKN